eukprot:TRINITY_DN3193_c0_g1_i2.p1 TRINITY_DN3193_c0_g1~~TRINITY_DN3193_c0_g1_i2.p1  ORF type:complete len:733 (+),score=210.81 TRINITY_DN3193_c0_g1_i2:66-2201(+)
MDIKQIVFLLVMVSAITMMVPTEIKVKKKPQSTICTDGNPVGAGYLPLGVRDSMWDKETEDVISKVRWAAIELHDREYSSWQRKELFHSVLGRIEGYRNLLPERAKIGLKGNAANPKLNEVLVHAARCAGAGFIPQTRNRPTVLAIRRSICGGGNEAFWEYNGSLQEACTTALALFQERKPELLDITDPQINEPRHAPPLGKQPNTLPMDIKPKAHEDKPRPGHEQENPHANSQKPQITTDAEKTMQEVKNTNKEQVTEDMKEKAVHEGEDKKEQKPQVAEDVQEKAVHKDENKNKEQKPQVTEDMKEKTVHEGEDKKEQKPQVAEDVQEKAVHKDENKNKEQKPQVTEDMKEKTVHEMEDKNKEQNPQVRNATQMGEGGGRFATHNEERVPKADRNATERQPSNAMDQGEAVNASDAKPRRKCKGLEDIYPGEVQGRHWVPKNCDIEKYDDKRAVQCVKRTPFLAMGDSLSRFFSDSFTKMFAEMGDKNASQYTTHVWNPSSAERFSTKTLSKKGAPSVDVSGFMKNTAKLALYSVTAWDSGSHFCGTDQYYSVIKQKIAKYKRLLGEDTRLVLETLPFVHFEGNAKWVRICNPVQKLEVFREMTLQLASCTGLGVFSIYELQKQSEKFSDGLHVYHGALLAADEVLLNVMCDGLELIHPNLPCSPEDEDRAKARWRAHPVANRFSPGCDLPTTRVCIDNSTVLPPLPRG